MNGERFNSVTDLVNAAGDESLADAIEERIASRQIISQLLAFRAKSDLSQTDIAEKLNCSQSRVSKLENGKDEDLQLRDMVAYAHAVGRHVHICFPERRTLFEFVKYHAFQISECLNQVAKM